MPTRKIKEEKEMKPCFSSDHNPPSHMVFEPGLYEHTCSACGRKITFRVNGIYLGPGGDGDTRGRREW